jgi:exodeoxyribonuclease V alpha subunit
MAAAARAGINPPAGERAEILAGVVERVVSHNPENGFCVLRVEARGHREPVTLSAALSNNQPGAAPWVFSCST